MANLRVYFAAALSNSTLNRRVANVISALGHHCYLPQDDPVNTREGVVGSAIAVRNREEIRSCDLLIALSRGTGLDTAWEVGYAKGLFKPCLLLCAETAAAEMQRSPTPFFSVDGVINVPTWDSPDSTYAELIAAEIHALYGRQGELINKN